MNREQYEKNLRWEHEELKKRMLDEYRNELEEELLEDHAEDIENDDDERRILETNEESILEKIEARETEIDQHFEEDELPEAMEKYDIENDEAI